MARILLIGHNQEWQDYVRNAIEPHHRLSLCSRGKAFSSHLRKKSYEVILLSLSRIERQGRFFLLGQIKLLSPYTPVVVKSKVKEANFIVEAIKKGAFDFIVEPLFLRNHRSSK
jgi:DNA-binding NtrC family response regulator